MDVDPTNLEAAQQEALDQEGEETVSSRLSSLTSLTRNSPRRPKQAKLAASAKPDGQACEVISSNRCNQQQTNLIHAYMPLDMINTHTAVRTFIC